MTTVYRPLGYTGTTQRLTVDSNMGTTVTAYLWGGGGGGGGGDSPGTGGAGQGGGYSQYTFSVTPGDTIDVAVGGAGQGGQQGFNTAGGSGGGSYLTDPVFNSRTASPIPYYDAQNLFWPAIPTYPVTLPYAWCSFLNTYGIWQQPYASYGNNFYDWYELTIPSGGLYTATMSADNAGSFAIVGPAPIKNQVVASFEWPTYTSAGQHTFNITTPGTYYMILSCANYGGPAGIALTISGGISYSGGTGGYEVPWSGAGGGGGGATVVLKNGSVVAVAGGGGGGGGGGHVGNPYGQSAPGPYGTSGSATNGANGQSNSSDGAGGGAGGGGWRGGNGGAVYGGDQGAYAGTGGASYGDVVYTASGRNPGYKGSYYPGTIAQGGLGGAVGGVGGVGTAGYAVVAFDVNGTFVNTGGNWLPVQKTWVKQAGSWTPVKTTYLKQNGVWTPILSSQDKAPLFQTLPNRFGVSSRLYGQDY